jgi:hypothetical protein
MSGPGTVGRSSWDPSMPSGDQRKGPVFDRYKSGPPEKQPEYQEEYKKLVSSGKIKLRDPDDYGVKSVAELEEEAAQQRQVK